MDIEEKLPDPSNKLKKQSLFKSSAFFALTAQKTINWRLLVVFSSSS